MLREKISQHGLTSRFLKLFPDIEMDEMNLLLLPPAMARKAPNLNHSIIVVHGGRYYKQLELGLGLPNNKASIRFLLSRTIIPSRIGWRVSHRVMDGFTLHAISLRAGTNEVRSKKKRDLPHRLAMLENQLL